MTFDERLRRAFDPVAERLREEIAAQINSAITELSDLAREQTDAAVASARVDSRRSVDDLSERLADAVRAVDRGRSLSEILDTLVDCLGRETKRVGVLLVRGSSLRGWRFSGFDGAFADGASIIEVAMEEAGVLAEAVRTREAVSGQVPSFARVREGQPCVAVPITIAGEVTAVVSADQGANADAAIPGPTIEVLVRHAARCLEALIAIKAARALTERADTAGGHSVRSEASEAEEADAAARRYAKLLISEIKLYHEADVVAGRRERDLAARLGGEIARARVMYEQRVSATVRERRDYFHEEVVRTLANGDSTLLRTT